MRGVRELRGCATRCQLGHHPHFFRPRNGHSTRAQLRTFLGFALLWFDQPLLLIHIFASGRLWSPLVASSRLWMIVHAYLVRYVINPIIITIPVLIPSMIRR